MLDLWIYIGRGIISTTQLSICFAGQTSGFGFPVSDSPENCRLKSIGLKLMDPGGSNLINEYPHSLAENNFKLIDVK